MCRIKIKNLLNVANQFVITEFDKDGEVSNIIFQSYENICCIISLRKNGNTVKFGRDYKYSKTTSKYLHKFLSEYPLTDSLIDNKIIDMTIKDKGYKYLDNWVKVVFDKNLY